MYKKYILLLLLYVYNIVCDDIANFTKPTTLPKYFSIDIDGTFYTSNKEKFEENIAALKLLKDKNITPFFCTGKDPKTVELMVTDDFKSKTNYNGYPGIYGNGTLVYDSEGNPIKVTKLSEELLTKYKTYANSRSIMNLSMFMTDEGLFCLEDLANETKTLIQSLNYKEPVQITFNELKQKNVVSISVTRNEVDDFVGTSETAYVKYNKYNLIQMSSKDCNKKTALEALLTHLNSKADECVHIGDNVNDREAMEFCGLSFAVGDSDDETKQKAKWVLDLRHDEGAFAKAVKLLCDD